MRKYFPTDRPAAPFILGFGAMFNALRIFGLVGALLFTSAAAFAQAQPSLRVMSLNMCTDQLILNLLPPPRITSVTFLSHASPNAALSAQARQVGINYGTAEEVLAQRPDLVVSGDSSTPTTRAILDRAGYRLYEVASADTFDEIRETTRKLGRALGEEGRAEALLAQMDATLNGLIRTMPAQKITIVAWDGGGFVPGRGLLFNEILSIAGGINIAAVDSTDYLVDFDLEELLHARPDLIAYASGSLDAPSLTTQVLRHPIVRRLYEGRQITYADNLYICGLPQSAEAARNLRAAMLGAVASGDDLR
jgi:iron complex transport system substrate-binding protein